MNKNCTVTKKSDTNAEEILTPSIKGNVEVLLNNEHIFKIVVILISCLNKLHHVTGNSNK